MNVSTKHYDKMKTHNLFRPKGCVLIVNAMMMAIYGRNIAKLILVRRAPKMLLQLAVLLCIIKSLLCASLYRLRWKPLQMPQALCPQEISS